MIATLLVPTVLVGLVKMPNLAFDELTCAKKKRVCESLYLIFVFIKSDFTEIFIISYTFKCIFGVGALHGYIGTFLGKEGVIQVLAIIALSSQTVSTY